MKSAAHPDPSASAIISHASAGLVWNSTDSGTPAFARRTAFDVHPRVAMRILRHSKFDITMEVYTKVSDEATREALRRLGEELG